LKTQALERIALKLEPWLVGSLVMYFLGVNTHPLIVKLMKPGSYAILAALISWRWKRFAYIATRDIPLLILIGMSAASILWSAAPAFTADEFKAAIRGSMLGVYLATRYSMKEQMRLWTWVLGIGAVLSVVLPLILPNYGRFSDAWVGIFGYKNLAACFATLTAILFLFVALNSKKHSWVAWTLFCISVFLLVVSNGKTAYSIFVISLCLFPMFRIIKQQYKLRAFLFLTVLTVLGSALVLIVSNLEFIVVDTLGKDMQFNGRLPIWQLILDKVFERPLLGYGAAGFWTSEHALYVINNTWASDGDRVGIGGEGIRFNGHNGYLDFLLEYGFIGLSLYICSVLTTLFRLVTLVTATATVESFWMLQILIALLLFNIADRIGMPGQSSLWSLYVSIALSTALQSERMRKKRYVLNKHETAEPSKSLI
jgi:O-antigen ligase